MLHELNRDMLIKLVETVNVKWKRELELVKSELEELRNFIKCSAYVHSCSVEFCKAMEIENTRDSVYLHCKDIHECSDCSRLICDKHAVKIDPEITLCDKCGKRWSLM